MTESLFIPLVLAAVLSALIARDSQRSWRWHVLTGLLVGLASLTRGNGLELLLPIGFLVWSQRPRLTWRALRGPLIVVLTTAVTLIPWTVRNEHLLHQFVPIDTQSGYLLAGIYNSYAQHRSEFPALWIYPVEQQAALLAKDPHLNEAQLGSRLQTNAVDYVEAHPASVLKTVYWNALRTLNLPGPRFELWDAKYVSYPGWLASASVYAFWALALVALASAVAGAGRRVPWALWACPGIVVLSSVLLTGETRYRAPADPFLVMLAAAGLVAMQRRRTRRAREGPVPHPIPVRSAG
jgi:4-amino-4-deoxy-L-arabinose transferase-like glycosyltransferase